MDPIFDDVVRVERCSLVSSTTYLIPQNYMVTKKWGENKKTLKCDLQRNYILYKTINEL